MVLTLPSLTNNKWLLRLAGGTFVLSVAGLLGLLYVEEPGPDRYGICFASRARPMPCKGAKPSLSSSLIIGGADLGQATPVGDSLRKLDSFWARSYATHDTVTARALFSDDIVVTGGSGQLKDKNGELADIRPAAGLTMKYFRTSDVMVRVYDASAVVTGLAEWSFTYNGRDNSPRRRYTATYVRGGTLGWRIVALHLGPAPSP